MPSPKHVTSRQKDRDRKKSKRLSNRKNQKAEVSPRTITREIARKVYEGLSESDHLEMLLKSPSFVELVELTQALDSTPSLTSSLEEYMRARGDSLRSDPYYLTHVFQLSWPNRRPPTWVMDRILGALLRRCEGGSLDELLGFSGVGKNPKLTSERRQRLLPQFAEIARLVERGSISVREAAHLVVCRDNPDLRKSDDLEKADELQSKTNTLVTEFQHFSARRELRGFFKHSSETTDEKFREYVMTFPRREVLQTKLKELLR